MISIGSSLNPFSPSNSSVSSLLRQFPKLCGMTGTAATESAEFESIYKLKVTIVPTNKPMIRKVSYSDAFVLLFRVTLVHDGNILLNFCRRRGSI